MPAHRLLTPAVRARIVAGVKAGATRRTAARAAGIARSTLFNWIRRGRLGEPVYVELATGIDRIDALRRLRPPRTGGKVKLAG